MSMQGCIGIRGEWGGVEPKGIIGRDINDSVVSVLLGQWSGAVLEIRDYITL